MIAGNMASRLRELRKERGLSPADLGAVVGRSGKTIEAYETGTSQPSSGMLIELCGALGVDVSEFAPASPGAHSLSSVMERRGVNQGELCEMTGIPSSTMSRYVSGADIPSSKLGAIASALGVTADEILGGAVGAPRSTKDAMRQNLGRLLSETGMKNSELASRLGVSRAAVSNWLGGVNGIDVELVPAICGLFGVSADELMGMRAPSDEHALLSAYRRLDAHDRDVVTRLAEALCGDGESAR